MPAFASLTEAMAASDPLAEAERRYELLAEVYEDTPNLRPQINKQLGELMADILRLRAQAADAVNPVAPSGNVVAFDATRFRKSG